MFASFLLACGHFLHVVLRLLLLKSPSHLFFLLIFFDGGVLQLFDMLWVNWNCQLLSFVSVAQLDIKTGIELVIEELLL